MSVLENDNTDNGEKFVKAVMSITRLLIYALALKQAKDIINSERSEKEKECNDQDVCDSAIYDDVVG